VSDLTQLKIYPAYPLQIELIEKPRYETIKVEASLLSGSNLDCALGISMLNDGTLYLYFTVSGDLDAVSYEPPGGERKSWSPSSDSELSNRLLQENGYPLENTLENLRNLVEAKLGSPVELLRLKRASNFA
jgi:hypothetical protein